MLGTLKKAIWLLKNRPLQFWSTFRGFFLFLRTRMLSRFFLNESQGYTLGKNVRLQRLSCLSAERPDASIEVGQDSIIYENARIEAYGSGKIHMGVGCVIGDARIYSRKSIRIGNRVVTSWNVFIQDFDPHPISPSLRSVQLKKIVSDFKPQFETDAHSSISKADAQLLTEWGFPAEEVEIGDDVWIGANVSILKGARIGSGCIIATGSVVLAGHWPEGSILAGVPAKVVKSGLSKTVSEQPVGGVL